MTFSEPTKETMRKSDWAIALAVALCAVALAACGSSAGSSGGGQAASEEASLEFAECMRAHGVEVEDPKPGKSVDVGGQNDPKTRKALTACNGKLGDAGQELSAEEGEEFKEGWLAFAKCVREHGLDMADPTFKGPGKVLLDQSATSSPAFEVAREACQGKTLELHGINIGG
jgi:predicted small secreted protein